MSNDPFNQEGREDSSSLIDRMRSFILSSAHWKEFLGLGLVLVVLLGLAWGMDWLGSAKTVNAGEITIAALLQDSTGVDPGTAFSGYRRADQHQNRERKS